MTAIHCSQCGSIILNEELEQQTFRECTGCGSQIRGMIFPAYYRPSGPVKTEAVTEGESSCYFHPHKRALVPCDECGRFLCSLCRVEFGDRNVCPECIGSGAGRRKLPSLEMGRRQFDTIALAVAVFPALLIWPTLLTSPIAMYLSVRHWNDPAGILPRSRWRLVAAFGIAFLQAAGWAALVLFVIANWRNLQR